MNRALPSLHRRSQDLTRRSNKISNLLKIWYDLNLGFANMKFFEERFWSNYNARPSGLFKSLLVLQTPFNKLFLFTCLVAKPVLYPVARYRREVYLLHQLSKLKSIDQSNNLLWNLEGKFIQSRNLYLDRKFSQYM